MKTIDGSITAADGLSWAAYVFEPIASPYAALAVIVLLGAAQWVKLLVQLVWPETTRDYVAWCFVRSTIFVALGAIAGTVLWLNEQAGAEVVPIMAFAPGLAWLVALAALDWWWPALSHKLRTPADRRHRNDPSQLCD